MKKGLILAVALLFTACTNSTIVCTGSSIEIGGKPVEISEHRGTSASTVFNMNPLELNLVDSWDSSTHNPNKMVEKDMFSYEKAKYILIYNSTQLCVHLKTGDMYTEAFWTNINSIKGDNVVPGIYSIMKAVGLGDYKNLSFEDKVIINAEGLEYRVRPNEIIVPQLIRVCLDSGKVPCTEDVIINKTTIKKGNTSGYDFYLYKGVLVQVPEGYDIKTVVKFK